MAKSVPDANALEVGFATGSTAVYILSGLEKGKLISIDYAQDQFEREGVALVSSLGLQGKHNFLEGNSIVVLPNPYQSEDRFGLIYLDGWKTFDHVWVDVFYCAKILAVDGYMVFDDTRMPAVRKCMSILKIYYGFEVVNNYHLVGGLRQRLWHVITGRSLLSPYGVLRKVREINETDAGKNYSFWKAF